MSAATYYVSPSGSNTAPYDTWAKAAHLLSTVRALNPAGGPHTVYIAPGTYNDQVNFGNVAWNNANFIGTSAHGGLLPAQKGQVIFSYLGAVSVFNFNTSSGITIQNISATGGDATHATVNIGSNNTTLDNVYLYDSSLLLNLWNASGVVIKNSLLRGASGANMVTGGGLSSSWTIQYSQLVNSPINPAGTSSTIAITSGTLNLYNDFIGGSQGYGGTVTGGNSGIINLKNSIILPGSNSIGGVPVANNGANNFLNLDNNILVKNWFSGVYKTGTPTIENNTISSSPLIKKHPRKAFLVPSVDDCAAISYATSVLEPILGANGEKGTLAIQGDCAGANQSILRSMLSRGIFSVGVHSYSHSDMSLSGVAFTVTKPSGSTIGMVNIDRMVNTITLTDDGGTHVISNFKTATLYSIKNQISNFRNGSSGNYWSVSNIPVGLSASSDESSLGEILSDSVGAKVSPYNAQLLIDTTNATGFYNVEIAQAKSAVNSALGINAPVFIPPYGYSNANTEDAAFNAGFSASRPGSFSANSQYLLDSIDLYRIGYFTLSAVSPATHENVAALLEAISQFGGIAAVLAHNTSEYTSADWQFLLNEAKEYPEITVTDLDTAINTIKTGGDWSTSDNKTYTKAWTDESDYTLKYNSPAIDAGISTSLTIDFSGNPIYGTPDIGAYEYQPPHAIGTDKIDIAAGARIYGDGKFRDLSATSSNMADLKIAPASGSFPTFNATDTRPEWLNISNITWTNTGNHHKAWTESSATLGAASTLHTIGDLQANKLYNVSVDSSLGQNISGANGTTCTNGICQANAQGKISFLYTGGYSTHTFDVIEGDNTAPTTTANINAGLYNTTQNVLLTCDDGSGVGCDKTYYTIDGNDPTTGSTQYSTPINISVTTTLKYFSQDKNGNSESVQTKTYTIDTTPPNTTITTQPDSVINTSNANFTFEADENSTFQCKIDSDNYSTCASPKSYTGLVEGSHTFSVKATDTATNEDATPAEFTFVVDTQIPTLSNLSPNGTILPAATTSANLILNTSEQATCKYAATSGVAYDAMTLFDNTNADTHSTLVTNLSPGVVYDFYIKCKDTINESSEGHLSFSVAAAATGTITEKVKLQIDRDVNKFKDTIKIASTKFKLKSQDQNLANGNVEIYKEGKLWKTVSADASGAWSSTLKLGKNASEKIKILFYDVFGNLIGNQSAKVKVDSEDPKFIKFITPFYATGKGSTLYWEAKDNQAIDHYKVTFNGKTKNVKNARFAVPASTPNGTYQIVVKAYDKVGNSAAKKTWVRIR